MKAAKKKRRKSMRYACHVFFKCKCSVLSINQCMIIASRISELEISAKEKENDFCYL